MLQISSRCNEFRENAISLPIDAITNRLIQLIREQWHSRKDSCNSFAYYCVYFTRKSCKCLWDHLIRCSCVVLTFWIGKNYWGFSWQQFYWLKLLKIETASYYHQQLLGKLQRSKQEGTIHRAYHPCMCMQPGRHSRWLALCFLRKDRGL